MAAAGGGGLGEGRGGGAGEGGALGVLVDWGPSAEGRAARRAAAAKAEAGPSVRGAGRGAVKEEGRGGV